jgi:hypothetical protein
MRAAILAAALVLAAAPADAATFKCRGFAFGYAELDCETADPARSVAGFCDVMNRQGGAVLWSRDDTRATKERADLINAAGKRLCGWGRR